MNLQSFELGSEQPRHFCPTCSSIAYDTQKTCWGCRTGRPEEGWRPLCDAEDPWLGRVLDQRFLITRFLAAGSTARVYRAQSLRIPRDVAIKIVSVSPQRDGSLRDRRRIEREIDTMCRLRNPHVVAVHDVIEPEPDTVALVMDYIDGATLQTIVGRTGPLLPHDAINVVRQMAEGLASAHDEGIVHRDLKPANILVERLPVRGYFVYLLDFGIAYETRGESMTRGFIGSPLFASPEQIRGKGLSPQSDIYSLGVVFFYALVGKAPYIGDNYVETLKMHLNEPVPTLQEHADFLVPDELEYLILAMLAKDPSRRPRTAEDVIRALDSLPQRYIVPERPLPPPSNRDNDTTIVVTESGEIGDEPEEGDDPDNALVLA